MDLSSILCNIVNNFSTYSSSYDKIKAGFFTYKECVHESKLIDAEKALKISITGKYSDQIGFFFKNITYQFDFLRNLIQNYPKDFITCHRSVNPIHSMKYAYVTMAFSKKDSTLISYFINYYKERYGFLAKEEFTQLLGYAIKEQCPFSIVKMIVENARPELDNIFEKVYPREALQVKNYLDSKYPLRLVVEKTTTYEDF